MKIGLQNVRCDCLSKANIYWDGKKAKCPVCGKEYIVEWVDGEPSGIIPSHITIV